MSARTTQHLPRLAVLWALGALTIAATGCDVSAPKLPSYNTTVTVPLGLQRIAIADAVGSSDFLTIGPDSSLGFNLSGDPDTLGLDFNLTVAVPAQTINQGLGNFDLPALTPLVYNFQLGQIWAPANGLSGFSVPVPAFPINVNSSGQSLPGVASATLSDGTLSVTITNNMPVPVSANSGPDQIILQVENAATGSLIATLTYPLVAPGTTNTQLANLAGATLSDQVSIRLSGGSPGSSGQLVTVSSTDALTIGTSFANLVVSSATAAVDAQTFTTALTSPLPADYSISYAGIASGTLDITLTNGMPLSVTAVVVWDQITSSAGIPLVQSFDLPAGASAVSTLDFAGASIQAATGSLSSLNATVSIVTPGSLGLPVTMTASDGITATLSPGNITFDTVTGSVPAFTVPISPVSQTIDLPQQLSGLRLTAAQLTLNLSTTAGLPADVMLTLQGTAADGTIQSLPISERIAPATGNAAVKTIIMLDQSNSTILQFLNNLPESITLSGEVTAGGVGNIGTVSASDIAIVDWAISAPVEVVITDATINSAPTGLNLDLGLRDRIATHAGGAVLRTEIRNHLPMGVQLRIVVAQDTTLLDTNPLLSVGPIIIAAATVDPTTHVVTGVVTSSPIISLTAAEAQVFSLPGLYTRIEAILPSTNGQPVAVMSNDYLEFQGVVELEVLIDEAL